MAYGKGKQTPQQNTYKVSVPAFFWYLKLLVINWNMGRYWVYEITHSINTWYQKANHFHMDEKWYHFQPFFLMGKWLGVIQPIVNHFHSWIRRSFGYQVTFHYTTSWDIFAVLASAKESLNGCLSRSRRKVPWKVCQHNAPTKTRRAKENPWRFASNHVPLRWLKTFLQLYNEEKLNWGISKLMGETLAAA